MSITGAVAPTPALISLRRRRTTFLPPAAPNHLPPPDYGFIGLCWPLQHQRQLVIGSLRPEPVKTWVAKTEDSSSSDGDGASVPLGMSWSSLNGFVELAVLFLLWVVFNIYFNIYNKQVLKVFPYPATLTTVQFGIGTLLVLFMWSINFCKIPKASTSQLAAILPLAAVHTLGNFFTNMSLGNVAVSFTHTIKAMEPFFSVMLSTVFLGEIPNIFVLASLFPVVGGVVLASFTEASFNWTGFWSAMASNVANQFRNVFSKKLMAKKEEALDNIALFSLITILSFLLSIPVTLITDGMKLSPSYVQSIGLDLREIYMRSILAGICFHTYQQVAYMILSRVSPVTLSVSNCLKRVVVITSAILFFRTPVSFINSLGTAIALAGVFLYSRVKS